ncbi:ceramide synthase 5 isoform X2 [Phycodurus eques]|uniref:ceramide synthase 5 isoform X2 n=1 Tax=Phycodurus eques TaxID=693459 RepID=UPI002ACD7B5E|nr:ceramide synthase 5 isoform X2 [Phycodurus eques]
MGPGVLFCKPSRKRTLPFGAASLPTGGGGAEEEVRGGRPPAPPRHALNLLFVLPTGLFFSAPWGIMAALSAWFWNERFWLPRNVTWADLAERAAGVEYPQAGHLLAAFPLAVGMFAVRMLFERFVASTCARRLHIHPDVERKAQPNAVLEKVFTSITKNPDSRHLDGLSKQLDWEVRKVQRWFRQRRNQDKPSTHAKFCESMWRLTFYLCIFMYGFQFLWQTSWMWDTRHCWYGYPYQVLTPALYRYYVTELAFYWSLLFSQFTDIRRKDFLSMFVHHLATVGLISFSYANNMVRVGTLVMCVHDASDFLLEAAKLANYAKYQRLCDLLFIIFSLTFFLTRLVIFPIWVLNSTMFESWLIVGPFPSWWLFNVLLLVLQVLHVIWSYLIARIAIKAVLRGKKLLGSSPCGLTDPIFLSVCVLFFAPLCPLSTPLTTLRFFLAVCNDVRSDVESSSEDESPASRRTRTTHARKAENGTNGHYAAARSRPHATPT